MASPGATATTFAIDCRCQRLGPSFGLCFIYAYLGIDGILPSRIPGNGGKKDRMFVKVNVVLIMAGAVLALVGLLAPAATLGDGPESVSLSGLAGTLSGLLGDTKTVLPGAMKAIKIEVIYGSGVIFLMAVAAALLAWFKFLRLSLAPSLLMTAVAGYLLFRIGASGAARIDFPGSWGWIPLISGSLVSLGAGVFALFGTGEETE